MNYDLTRLRNGIDRNVVVDDYYSFTEEQLKGTDLTKLDDVHIEGEISLNAIDELYLSLEVTGNMVIPCAITLKPVEVPFDIIIADTFISINIIIFRTYWIFKKISTAIQLVMYIIG